MSNNFERCWPGSHKRLRRNRRALSQRWCGCTLALFSTGSETIFIPLSLSLSRFFTFPLLSRSRIFPTFPCRPPCTYTRSLVRSLSVGFIIVFLFAFPSGATRRAAAVAVPAILPTGHDNSFHSLSSAVNHTAQTRDTPVCYASAEGSTHLGIHVRSLWTFINYFARAPTFWSA